MRYHVINVNHPIEIGKLIFEDNKWVIIDGDGIKGSKNGTWLYANEFIDLENDMEIKAAQVILKVSLIENFK